MLLLVGFIRIGWIYLAVDYAASEAVKQVAVHSYPLRFADKGMTALADKTGVSDLDIMDSETGGMITNHLRNDLSQAALDRAAAAVMEKLLDRYRTAGVLQPDSLTITYVQMANPWRDKRSDKPKDSHTAGGEDVVLAVRYTIRPLLPLMPLREFTITQTVAERAWMDDPQQ